MVQSGEFGLASPELAIQGFGPDNQSEPRVGIPPCQRPLRPIVSHFVPFRLRLASSSSEPRQYSLEILACSWVGNAIRLLRATAALLALAQGALFVHAQQPIPATQLIREVVFNELNDHRGHGYRARRSGQHNGCERNGDYDIGRSEGHRQVRVQHVSGWHSPCRNSQCRCARGRRFHGNPDSLHWSIPSASPERGGLQSSGGCDRTRSGRPQRGVHHYGSEHEVHARRSCE